MLNKIKANALAKNIPIMSDDTLAYLIDSIDRHYVKDVLEIGTAIGYSSLSIAYHCPEIHIDTLEKDEARYQEALKNKALLDLKQVHMICADARTWLVDKFYDVIIIDGAKGQNQLFFDRYFPFLKQDGIMFVDNMYFHGFVKAMPQGKTKRNLRQMVNKIAKFDAYVHALKHIQVELVDVGDGLLKITRKKE